MMSAAVPETLPERVLWTCSGILLLLQQADPFQRELVHQAVQPRLCVQGPVDKLTGCCSYVTAGNTELAFITRQLLSLAAKSGHT